MLKTRITELFGIEHPVVGGCMMHISGPEFVASISNAGALGMMASAMYDSQEGFREAVREVKARTDKPFGVNLSLFPALRPIDNDLYVQVILEEEVALVETSGHRPPEDLLARLKAGGVKTMHKCVAPRHALSAQKAGVDAVTVFGTEGGGHIGELGLSTMDRRILLLAGMAGGVGATFRSPLGGALFAVEVLYRDPEFEHEGLIPCIISSITAYSLFGAVTGWEQVNELVGVMGFQPVDDVTLIRHAYVLPQWQRQGIASRLIDKTKRLTKTPRLLVGTWADAYWAVALYQKHGFRLMPNKDELLKTYWKIPQHQIETSVVLELE